MLTPKAVGSVTTFTSLVAFFIPCLYKLALVQPETKNAIRLKAVM